MTNKIPYIASFGRVDITQEQAETEIFTAVKVCESYMKYINLLESQLKIQDTAIDKLEKKYKRTIDSLFYSNVLVVILLFTLGCVL